ncbi:hypothetical protein EDS67_29820 [candidate division KSB1 bacterium]|nr:MAG: hypothetical protein EDS67_29820 [candidate division KSB1 bacterium]MBC6951436.1 hypothetical protein [candidate division KSB1 bacterium]RIK69106.1 MAG: hypothetical protein DCC62_24035 [candidate division KSB1 bacterium]
MMNNLKNLDTGAALIGDENLDIDLRHRFIIFHCLRSKLAVSIELNICNKIGEAKKCREGDSWRESVGNFGNKKARMVFQAFEF